MITRHQTVTRAFWVLYLREPKSSDEECRRKPRRKKTSLFFPLGFFYRVPHDPPSGRSKRDLVPIGNQKQGKKWRPIFEKLQNSKMEDHFWVTEYEIQKYFEIDECNDVIKAVGSYYNQEPAVINSWKQPRSKGNVWINVRRGASVINHLSSIIFQIWQLAPIAGRVCSREERAVINSWNQPRSKGNVWINVRRGASVFNHLSSIIFQIWQLAFIFFILFNVLSPDSW